MSKNPTYNDVLKEALESPSITNCNLSREAIEKAIADISQQLRGVMSTGERLVLVADRAELRATLKGMPEASYFERYAGGTIMTTTPKSFRKLAQKWHDPEFWKSRGNEMDSGDCADELERLCDEWEQHFECSSKNDLEKLMFPDSIVEKVLGAKER